MSAAIAIGNGPVMKLYTVSALFLSCQPNTERQAGHSQKGGGGIQIKQTTKF